MRNKLLSLVAGGLASIGGWTLWSGTATADQPRPVVPVQTAINVDTGSVPIQLVDRRWRRDYGRGYYRDRNYYGYGYGYSYPRYRYYSYGYPRYYYSYPYGSYYSSYYSPYYYPSGGIYFTW
jgi:hypothetical protein